MKSKAPIFLIGLPRSGSTLWARVMNKNPELAVYPEMHFLNPWNPDFRTLIKSIGAMSDDRNIEALVDAIFSEPPPKGIRRGPWFWAHLRNLNKNGLKDSLRRRLTTTDERDIGVIFRAIIEESTRCQSKSRALVQFPVYPIYMKRLVEWWPDAYLIFISRDPRALAASKTNDPGGMGKMNRKFPLLKPIFSFAGLSFATLQYIIVSRAHFRMIGRPNYRNFSFEDLVRDPEKTIKEVCRFCDLEFNEAMLQPTAGQPSSITGERSSGFDESRITGWQKTLSPWQSTLVTVATAASMRRFNYTPKQ